MRGSLPVRPITIDAIVWYWNDGHIKLRCVVYWTMLLFAGTFGAKESEEMKREKRHNSRCGKAEHLIQTEERRLMEPLSNEDQALVARSINELPTKDDVRAVLRIMAEAGHEDMAEIPVHKLSPELQQKLYDFVTSISALGDREE